MPTITMNVSLPDTLKAFVDQRVVDRGYGSHSEYVRDLVRKDEIEAAKDQMRALIAAGLSAFPEPVSTRGTVTRPKRTSC